ncbi:MAG: hypothetical protein AMS27_12465 [Bacteroides sp. SM23_62_1]|nr:MAG: hypothetical protein AMS27_12465 [Bacteroides sp. SM23_62_1]
MKKWILIGGLFHVMVQFTAAQPVPAGDENIPFLMTFGNTANPSWGDDDYSQTFFFLIPENFTDPIYIRIFDPDIGGENDEVRGEFDTRTTFEIFGGQGCQTDPDAIETDPTGNYKSGNLLASRAFGQDQRYDNNWYTFGPFNPTEGEYIEKWNGYVFKIIIEGIAGDDGNLYRMFLSTEQSDNKAIEGANAFAYEYSFRMHDNPNEVSHIYPFVDDRTVIVRQSNFDWDNDGLIRIVSVARKGQLSKVSGDNVWGEDEFQILDEEHNTSLDMQLIKSRSPVTRNNNVVINVRNQYNELLPFYVIPLGGVPQYKYNIGIKKQSD